MRSARAVVAAATIALASSLGGCSGDDGTGGLRVTSEAFTDGDAIPERFSCLGENVSPPLSWEGVPEEAVELAVIVDDPDAPDGPFFHWMLLRVAPATDGLEAGEVPAGALEAAGSSENATYIGMCPPQGEEHRYRFTVHALDERLGDDVATLPAPQVARRVEEASVAEGTLEGRFGG